MRTIGHQIFRAESARRLTCRVEARERGKSRRSARITVGKHNARQLNPHRRDVIRVERHIAEMMFEAGGIGGDIAILKIPGYAEERDRMNAAAGRSEEHTSELQSHS